MGWWGYSATPWGRIFLVASAKGICKAGFVDMDDRNRELLSIQGQQDDVRASNMLSEYGIPCLSRVPLDLHGTAFQVKVWEELCTVKCGETVTYGELARRMGIPKSVRAVASAVANNPVALFVPCHRVIPVTGKPGEYHWGASRKAALLEWEAIFTL